MRTLCEFIAKQTDALRRTPDVFLVSCSFDDTANQKNGFTVFGWNEELRPPFDLVQGEDLGAEGIPGLVSPDVAVLVGAGFGDWSALKDMIAQIGAANVDVLVLVPTGADAMSQASLSQFAAETAIRIQASGIAGELIIATQCDVSELAGLVFERAQPATLLGRLLEDLSPLGGAQLAILTLARPAPNAGEGPSPEPMFTVLTRTQGTRMETLGEVFLCMSAQTIGDFEHLVIAHNAKPDALGEIRQMIADQSDWMRDRIRFEEVVGGTRTTPLNAGFKMARGKYVIILDDDDIVFANWLETFRSIACQRPGTLLRAVAVRQEFTWAHVEGKRSARAMGAMLREYAPKFDYLDHLEVSQTPPVSIAFPRYLFARHDMHFDETLTTTEDWDYIMRCAARVGVGSADEITCIYRWWVNAENSRTVHAQSEWSDNHYLIQDKIDGGVNLMEPGSTRRYREIFDKMNEYLRWANKLHHDLMEIQSAADASNAEQAKDKITALSRSVQGELSTMLKDGPAGMMLLVPPQNDLLPPPRLSPWQKLLAGPETLERMRAKQRREAIEASGLFDSDWYLSTYSDVAEQMIDPLTHFVQFGSRELRSPSAQFNARSYYAANADLRDHKIEPVFHFMLHGKREGRRYEGHA